MPKPTVLVVDDDHNLREMLALALEKHGYRALHADGSEGLELARREQPAVILLDLNMPHPDGAELSQRLRGDTRTAHIPIVAMSGDMAHRRAKDMLAHDWLRKPFPLAALYQKVGRWA